MIIKLQAPRTANGYPLQLKIDMENKTYSIGGCQFMGGYTLAKKGDLHELAKELKFNGYKEQ